MTTLAVTLFIILGIYLIIALLSFPIVHWVVHTKMVKGDKHNQYGYANFKRFITEFKKYTNAEDIREGKSIFIKDKYGDYLVYIHAGIIRFNNVGMILYPIDWIRFCFWLRKVSNHKIKDVWK